MSAWTTLGRCGDCLYWERGAPSMSGAPQVLGEDASGACVIHAPELIVLNGAVGGFFPVTHESRSCGNFEARYLGGDPDPGEEADANVLRLPVQTAAPRQAA